MSGGRKKKLHYFFEVRGALASPSPPLVPPLLVIDRHVSLWSRMQEGEYGKLVTICFLGQEGRKDENLDLLIKIENTAYNIIISTYMVTITVVHNPSSDILLSDQFPKTSRCQGKTFYLLLSKTSRYQGKTFYQNHYIATHIKKNIRGLFFLLFC